MKPTDLREILRYIPKFRDKVFVISVDGQIVEEENFSNLLLDIAVLRSLNIKVVLVHGASYQIQQYAKETGKQLSDATGIGPTDDVTLDIALTVSNRLSHEILEGLSANDLRAAVTNAIVSHPAGVIHGKDLLNTGSVERVDIDLLQTLLEKGIISIIPPLGFDGDGKTYRINSDSIALCVSQSLNATKLIFVTPRDGVEWNGELLRQLSISEAEDVIRKQRGELPTDTLSKLEHGVKACQSGVSRVHIINGRIEEGLLAEVFSNEGVGTLIYANEYQAIRKAMKKDIRNIIALTKPSVQNEELLKRTRPSLEKQLGDFFVFEIDKNPVACIALHSYPNENTGELACLYVSPSHENSGIGKRLSHYVEGVARERGYSKLIALSTQAFTYFQKKCGFVEGTIEDLPLDRREKYEQSGRNSKILIKHLEKSTGAN
ncbi:MAG: amino-acid N-acetyltransferase, partial [Verrucomicrobiae bacterium]|nr:amino-acid N-acetyltransferase [Verrucomicrobiae bacterium]